jgi:succinyl-CoA synthetase alpha subunit
MSATILNEVRRGFYLDSVALMRLSREIADMDGVVEAALMMGTPSNKQIMADAGLLDATGTAAAGGDLVLGILAESPAAAATARDRALALLDTPRRPSGTSGGGSGAAQQDSAWRPRTIRAAVASAPGSNLALISVPGEFAAAEARKALRRGLHVMIFSDNVALADEVALKSEAREAGLLLMGPDCGTAIVNGVPLAFANAVPRGPIGLIGASGTGMQEISCLIAQGGGGISQAIGAGGRDLSPAVGGITTLMALEALDADPDTTHIVLVSKPPSAEVAARVMARIGASGKTFTVCFIGAEAFDLPANAVLATTLKAAAENALAGAGIDAEIGAGFDTSGESLVRRKGRAAGGRVVGLFAGGTLAAEAQVVFREAGQAVASNAPIPGVAKLAETNGGPTGGHAMIDLGADEHTQGRPHPMIDPSVRDKALHDALADPNVAVVLLDLVLGFGAHGDPAGHLAQTLQGRPAQGLDGGPIIVASVTGTEADPQPRAAQVATLEAAGVLVAPSNAQAAELACALCTGSR